MEKHQKPLQISLRLLAFSSEKGVSQLYWGVHTFLERKIGGHIIFDDQNIGSHKMTTDSVFILFKKTDFNTILACVGVRCIGDGGVIKFLLPKQGGLSLINADFL